MSSMISIRRELCAQYVQRRGGAHEGPNGFSRCCSYSPYRPRTRLVVSSIAAVSAHSAAQTANAEELFDVPLTPACSKTSAAPVQIAHRPGYALPGAGLPADRRAPRLRSARVSSDGGKLVPHPRRSHFQRSRSRRPPQRFVAAGQMRRALEDRDPDKMTMRCSGSAQVRMQVYGTPSAVAKKWPRAVGAEQHGNAPWFSHGRR